MTKNTKKDKSLIKRKNLIKILNQNGIKRITKDAILTLEKNMEKHLEEILEPLKQETIIQGRKTLKKEDVENVIEKMNEEEEFEIWRILQKTAKK